MNVFSRMQNRVMPYSSMLTKKKSTSEIELSKRKQRETKLGELKMKISSSTSLVLAIAIIGIGSPTCTATVILHDPSSRLLQQQDLNQTQTQNNVDSSQRNWWEFGLSDPIADEVALFYLGHTYFQGADIGEVLETIYRTNHSDPWSWSTEFTKTAERLEATGREFEEEGHDLSAGQTYLRAATYRRASLHRHPDPFHTEIAVITQQAVDNFDNFVRLTNYPCQAVRIPYEETTLPGYLCLNDQAMDPAPTIIYNQGKDGWMEDGKNVVDESMKRGYHVLLYDGPGMGRTIRLQSLPFRHDWENVITPIINYLEEQPQVDSNNLALISLSLGGFLAPRAACFEHRLKALIPNPGVVNWYRVYESELQLLASAFGFGPEIFQLLEDDPDTFDEVVFNMMETNDFLHWGFVDSMWHHGVSTPSDLMNEIKRFDIEDLIGDITTNTLVIDAEEETRAQAYELYEGLTNAKSKTYLKFTTEEAAQFHDQPGAVGVQSSRIFNWLDRILLSETNKKAEEEDSVNGDTTTNSNGVSESDDAESAAAGSMFHFGLCTLFGVGAVGVAMIWS